MIIDVHSHMLNPDFDLGKIKYNPTIAVFFHRLKTSNFSQYYEKFEKSLEESSVEKAVIVALEGTILNSNNAQTVEICKQNKNFLYGANLNPMDEDIEVKLSEAVRNNAALVKVLPSFQNINFADKRCMPFYEMLKENNLPLLVHTGIEHTLKSGNQELNNPKKLENAAKLGVKIICAHCGTPLYFWEKSYFDEWKKLALNYENVYGDLSAMILFLRGSYLKKIIRDKTLKSKVIFGTDFPAHPVLNLRKDRDNIFEDWYEAFKNLGFESDFFSRGGKLLNIFNNVDKTGGD